MALPESIDAGIFTYEERATFALRSLYRRQGYTQYRMGKFEDYDLYADKKDYLYSQDIVTFTDTNGVLKALKPDVTLSIVRNLDDAPENVQRVYYVENVYRQNSQANGFRELLQVGLECVGAVGEREVGEVLVLAAQSLRVISDAALLVVCDQDIFAAALDAANVRDAGLRARLRSCLVAKNAPELQAACAAASIGGATAALLEGLLEPNACAEDELERLAALGVPAGALAPLRGVLACLRAKGLADMLRIDYSCVKDDSYYNGIVFDGYVQGIPVCALAGGQYDNLMRRMGKTSRAVGFAVYMDAFEQHTEGTTEGTADIAVADTDEPLRIALPKGRLGAKALEILQQAGFASSADPDVSRKLIVRDETNDIEYFWVKPSDVGVYVERGVADIGVVGKDALLEQEPAVFELRDLGFGQCRMTVAAPNGYVPNPAKSIRVATSFPNIARRHFASVGMDADIITLHGSVEIAPLIGLSDVIVDLVETGSTLRANDMGVVRTIVNVSARLIANKAHYGFKQERIRQITALLCGEEENAR